jgi:hypothetical protein
MSATINMMSSENMDTLRNLSEQLAQMKAQVDALLSGTSVPVTGKKGKKASKADKPKRTHKPSEFALNMAPVAALCKEIMQGEKLPLGLPMRISGWLRNKEVHGEATLEPTLENVRAAMAFFESHPDFKSKYAKTKVAKPAKSSSEESSQDEPKKARKNPWADMTEEQKKERVAKMQAAKKAKKEGTEASASAPAPAPAPASASAPASKKESEDAEDDVEEVSLQEFTLRGKKYFRTDQYELWKMEDDGTQGEWVGVYDPKTEKIDITADEPVFD